MFVLIVVELAERDVAITRATRRSPTRKAFLFVFHIVVIKAAVILVLVLIINAVVVNAVVVFFVIDSDDGARMGLVRHHELDGKADAPARSTSRFDEAFQ